MWTALALSALVGLATHTSSTNPRKEYRAKNGERVLVTNSSKTEATDESRLEFFSSTSQLLCSLDFSSKDGEHGFGVVKAAWTPDQRFFVFSLSSSGGHQTWHSPTFFYDLSDGTLRSLDTFVRAAGISN